MNKNTKTHAKPKTRGEKVIAFIERYCVVPDGSLVGQKMRLEPFQKRFLLAVYDNPVGTRSGYLSIARKNGKTALIASIVLAHLAGPEAKRNSELVSGALSLEQAGIVYSLAEKMVNLSPVLRRLVRPVPSRKTLVGLALNTEFKSLAAEGKTAHGKSPVLAILDEVGQVRGPKSDFIDAIVTSQGAHETPLLLAISTQAPNDGDLFSIWIDDAALSGDPRVVSHVYAAEKDCDLMDEAQWRAANPALGIFRNEADLREQAERAARMPSAESAFRNLGLNQRVERIAPFIAPGAWKANEDAIDAAVFDTEPVYVGIDLSSRSDLTAMVVVAKKMGVWHAEAHFWTPERGLKERAQHDRAPYDVWHKHGYIRTTPGASVDYEYVAKDIEEILSGRDVAVVAFDRWRIDILKKEFERLEVELPWHPFGQGFKDMSPALDTLESLLLNGQLRHGNNPVLTMCAANARALSDPAGNRKLAKGRETGRIDGLVALAMAVGATTIEAKNKKPSYQMLFLG